MLPILVLYCKGGCSAALLIDAAGAGAPEGGLAGPGALAAAGPGALAADGALTDTFRAPPSRLDEFLLRPLPGDMGGRIVRNSHSSVSEQRW